MYASWTTLSILGRGGGVSSDTSVCLVDGPLPPLVSALKDVFGTRTPRCLWFIGFWLLGSDTSIETQKSTVCSHRETTRLSRLERCLFDLQHAKQSRQNAAILGVPQIMCYTQLYASSGLDPDTRMGLEVKDNCTVFIGQTWSVCAKNDEL